MGGGGERGSRAAADSRGEGGGVLRAKTMAATSARAPSAKPPFTVADLRKAIPPHCFQRSLLRSSAYLAFDLTLVALLLYSTRFFSLPSLPFQPLTSALLWAAYVVVQGWVCTGIWVIAHECGHGAFSDYGVVNDVVGMFLHTWLLVPYFSWKYSHRRHHSNTGSIERDEVFVPKRRTELAPYAEVMQHPMGRIAHIAITLTLGWPLYLTFNATGRKYDGVANHFDPYSHIFNARERLWVVVSDVGLLAVLAALASLARSYGIAWLLKVYVAPLMVVNLYLVLITLLQHTHPAVPHYDDSEWDWLRGALATVDRDYGFLNTVFHNIADTHVAHHLFSAMPHYHAREATEAIKPVLGPYYQRDDTPIVQALWRELRECVYVEADANGPKGVLWYSSKLRSD